MKQGTLRKKYDKKNVLAWMRKFGDQCIEAIYLGKKFKPGKRKVDRVIACGMGGSGAGGSLLRDILKGELGVPFEVFNSYHLPAYVGRSTLVFCVSFSGNTEETINCFKEAKKKGAYTVALSTGGKLKKKAGKNCIALPKSSPQPRMAIAYLSIPMLIVMQKMGLVGKKEKELNETVFLLKREQARLEEKAKGLAAKLRGKLAVVYAAEELQTIAYRFRTELNENSKQFALSHFLPEQNHNEINAYFGVKKANSHFIFLRHSGEEKKVKKRFKVLKKIFGKNFNVSEVQLEGRSLIAATFYALQLAALTSYHLALLNRVDPEPVPVIGRLKKALKK